MVDSVRLASPPANPLRGRMDGTGQAFAPRAFDSVEDGAAPFFPAETHQGPPLSLAYAAPDLSLIVCTLDEAASIGGVLREASAVLARVSHEIIVVDDSADERTADVVRAFASTNS